ncbi:MAG: nucleotidyltransferase domain-containing protein [Candidatus Melainabacteria bacterium]|nr:nucleotidyltransferase domain-containing protein [Candidatus Melainabacteria bacterium]
MNLEEKLNHYIKSITNAINVDLIILFGSYAKGNTHEYSDIDIAVISSELDPNEPELKHLRYIKDKANLFDPDLQLVAFPTKKFETETGVEGRFIREIKKTGKVIYQKPS